MKAVIGRNTKVILSYVLSVIMVFSLVLTSVAVNAADSFENEIKAFPESYKPYLRELHKSYPKWKFVAYNTGIDFATAVANEQSQSRSVMERSYNDLLKSRRTGDYNASTGTYVIKDGSTWVSASKNTVAYFMDPRNFLNDDFITMFELLSYDGSVHTIDGIEAVLNGSFMYKKNVAYFNSKGKYTTTSGSNYLYSSRIMDAAKQSKVSPYYLASKIVLEVGKGAYNEKKYPGVGAGNSVSGLYPGYEGIFNFYNIGAYDGSNAVQSGLKWASSPDKNEKYQRKWNTPGKSIIGGAIYIGEKYIAQGQNTTYFQRFNVKSGLSHKPYTHQYMTSIYGNAAESLTTSNAYKSNKLMDAAKTFVIPVYNNMPGENTSIIYGNSAKNGIVNSNVNMRSTPSTSGSIVVKLSANDNVKITQSVMTNVEYSVKWLNNPYWYKVETTKLGKKYTGYVSANYIDIKADTTVISGVPKKISTTLSNAETVFYETDDPAIATVDNDGVVTGKKEGTTSIRAYTTGGNFSVCTVNVTEQGVELDNVNVTIDRGKTKTVTATVYPSKLTNKKVTWKSDNKKVATVKAGVITAKAVGTTIIHATPNAGGKEAICKVTVIEPVKSISLSETKITLSYNQSHKLSATIKPANATYKNIQWSSSNTGVATVQSGNVKVVDYGSATITAKSNNGKTATCEVSVLPAKTTLKVGTRGYNNLKLSWTAIPNVDGYMIYRRTKGGKFELIKKTQNAKTTLIDSGLDVGVRYEYQVCAYAVVNGKTLTAKKSNIQGKMVIPAKPSISSLKKDGTKSIIINWNKINGATGYCIYRKDGRNGKYKLIKTIKRGKRITFTNTKLKSGVTYYYKVRAYCTVNDNKVYSYYSNQKSKKR